MIKKILEKIGNMLTTGDEEKKLVIMGLDAPKEPDTRLVGLFADIREEKVAEVIHMMLIMNEANKAELDVEKKRGIEFYLSTYGGSADDMFALYDIMKLVQKDTDISVTGMGKVMSAGVLILAAGTPGKRKIGKNCRVMLHSVIGTNAGNIHNLMNEMEAIQDLQDTYIDCIVQETKMTRKQLKKMLERKVDIYLSAEQAVEYGIADEII
jgi:ATP-dependent Clp endopeptidase proteolytic subunit ClpP